MIEEKGTYRGFIYEIVFQDLGHRCGYVGIPAGHKLYEVYYEDIPMDCHGGLTFSSFSNKLGPDVWWIGFDCNHLCDKIDIESLRKYYGDKVANDRAKWSDMELRGVHLWTKEDCIEECKHMIDQIINGEV